MTQIDPTVPPQSTDDPINPPAPPAPAGSSADGSQPHPRPEVISTRHLFRDQDEILIAHNRDTYRLRITRNGKLILTK